MVAEQLLSELSSLRSFRLGIRDFGQVFEKEAQRRESVRQFVAVNEGV